MTPEKLIEKMNKYRKENNIFQKSIQQRSEKLQAIMYDGPPFASGAPHFGHGLTSTIKDTLGRYKTMKGHKVVRNRGRDCHGLPVEKYVEKKLGLDGKKDIEKLGEEKFIEACRESVKNTNDERKRFIDTLGRRTDIDHAYFTMDLDYMESVMRIFQNLYKKNLVYKGFKIQGYCPSCATGLSNSEINDGYKDRQDPAITIKLPLKASKIQEEKLNSRFETTEEGAIKFVRAIMKDSDGRILLLLKKKFGTYILPGGKIDLGETPEQALIREIREELGVDAKQNTFLGKHKAIYDYGGEIGGSLREHHLYESTFEGTPVNNETETHGQMVRAKIIDADNDLGFAVQIEDNIIDDPEDIIRSFHSLYLYHKNIHSQITELTKDQENPRISALAWTTTPWTLPSNMFLAVGNFIKYALIFDKESKEYYVLAKDLLKKYYKNPDEYILVAVVNGEILAGMQYDPLFNYISKSIIPQKYQEKFFQILTGDFVSTEAGTGIVHQAPAFGEDDFNAVCQVLPQDESLDWLFLPVDEYGEFSAEVPDYQGVRVYDANKDIIKQLKDEDKLIAQNTLNHSYPHCRRCDTPLIYKAISSRFVKEHDIGKDTLKNTDKINFVPQTVKNRFQDILKSAPDWNISRNRYRGAPLPIREAEEDEENRIILGTLEEIYQHTKIGSENITKNIFIRHGRTDYNDKKVYDGLGLSTLSEEGKNQAQDVLENITELNLNLEETIIVISPLQRTFQTVLPYVKSVHGEDVATEISKKYNEIKKNFQKLFQEGKLLDCFHGDSSQYRFELTKNIFVDFRTTDFVVPESQDKKFHCNWLMERDLDEQFGVGGEAVNDLENRLSVYLKEINEEFKGKTIITVSHADNIVLLIKQFRDFDYKKKRDHYKPSNGSIRIHYRDNDRQKEVDLHKPYVDNYRFKKDGLTYKRIPEVLDCRFESGSMPYGQVNYKGDKDRTQKQKRIKYSEKNYPYGGFHLSEKLPYPSDYIVEGLDQTRGWFRTLHVLGNGIIGKNAFTNVVINGLVLAEDGKKMSKKLKNYPDPKYLFHKFGSDSYRLYLLASPSVKAEPVRFTEHGVEQIYKDFNSSISNAYKFFETYAKVDNFQHTKPDVFFIRHAEAESKSQDAKLTDLGKKSLETTEFIQNIIRINPEIIYCSTMLRAKQTAEAAQKILKKYQGKDIEIIEEENFALQEGCVDSYKDLLEKESGKKVLIVGHNFTLGQIRNKYYNPEKKEHGMGENTEIEKLPTYEVTNDLDKRILAELHNLIEKVETDMDSYILDTATKQLLGFIDKLTNRYIRRSRRRFRASGMDADKSSAYYTLFEVLNTYLKVCAPFAPFVTEYLRLELNKFRSNAGEGEAPSIHLELYPMSSQHYIDQQLLDEISMVRRIITLGLFIRSKNNIKIKQPLQKLELQIE